MFDACREEEEKSCLLITLNGHLTLLEFPQSVSFALAITTHGSIEEKWTPFCRIETQKRRIAYYFLFCSSGAQACNNGVLGNPLTKVLVLFLPHKYVVIFRDFSATILPSLSSSLIGRHEYLPMDLQTWGLGKPNQNN